MCKECWEAYESMKKKFAKQKPDYLNSIGKSAMMKNFEAMCKAKGHSGK